MLFSWAALRTAVALCCVLVRLVHKFCVSMLQTELLAVDLRTSVALSCVLVRLSASMRTSVALSCALVRLRQSCTISLSVSVCASVHLRFCAKCLMWLQAANICTAPVRGNPNWRAPCHPRLQPLHAMYEMDMLMLRWWMMMMSRMDRQ